MTPRAAFIHGYYVAKIESLANSMQHVDVTQASDIRDKILNSAAAIWDLIDRNEDEAQP